MIDRIKGTCIGPWSAPRCLTAGLMLLSLPQAVTAVEVRATHIDGSSVRAQWLGLAEHNRIRLQHDDRALNIPLGDISELAFEHSNPAGDENGPVVFHLADGGRLYGRFIDGRESAVVSDTLLGDAVALPFNRLAGLELARPADYPRAAELFRSALNDRLPGKDVLVTRSTDEPQAVPGRLQRVGPEEGVFVFGGRERTFRIDNVYGIVLAVGVTGAADYDTSLVLADDSMLSGSLEGADDRMLTFDASIDRIVELPLRNVARILVRSERVVFVSDLTPQRVHTEGLLHRPWPLREDRNVSGGPLHLGGRSFDKGLGCHSRTEVVYAIDGAYESFVATIGIDDSMRPRGSVVFRVKGDGKVLFDSGEVTGRTPPRNIVVDVRGVDTLTLVVDYGEGLDLADHADWGDARLLRPRSEEDSRTNGTVQ